MKKIRDAVRLHRDLVLGQREIARALEIRQARVYDYLRPAARKAVWRKGKSREAIA